MHVTISTRDAMASRIDGLMMKRYMMKPLIANAFSLVLFAQASAQAGATPPQ